jgi:hypothetical protein
MLFGCIFSLISSRCIDYSNHIYNLEFEVRDNNNTAKRSSYPELHQESGSEGYLRKKPFNYKS